MMGSRLYLLGMPRLEKVGIAVTWPESGPEPLALLAYLALIRQPQRRETIAALLWPGEEPADADARLDQALGVLAEVLGPNALLDPDGRLRLEDTVWLDVDHFWRLQETCGTHGHSLGEVCPRCLPLLGEALDHYGGDLMTGWSLAGHAAYEDWLIYERDLLRSEAKRLLHHLVRGHSAQGEYELAIAYGRRWLQMDPWREQAHRTLMSLYAWTGDLSAARRQYEDCARAVRAEVGQVPEQVTRELHAALQSGQIPIPPSWDALFSSRATPVRRGLPHSLAHPRTPFVNRERELRILAAFLSQARQCQLVTLVGPAGIGKTRLAMRAADQARQSYPDGVYLIPLASLPSADLLLSAIADALGLAAQGRSDPKVQLVNYCREKRLLLVLDSLEHLLTGAGVSGLDLLADLLDAAPQLSVLATSRRPLGIEGECIWTVGRMTYPPDGAQAGLRAGRDQPYSGSFTEAADDVPDYGALRLFLESVRRGRLLPLSIAERVAAAAICRLVEGLPLGLEMASAWATSIPLAEIQSGLEDALRDQPAADAQRSLRATFEYSWRLLSASEQRALAQLSVFQGTFSRQAAEQVASVSPFMLASLVDKALLRGHPVGRFDMHEWVRELAAQKLAQMPGVYQEARERHCITYCQMLHQLERDLLGAEQGRALAEVSADMDNVRAAWRWAVDHSRTHELSLAVESLHLYTYHRGWIQEGLAAFVAALDAVQAERHAWLRARLLARAGRLSGRLGLYAQAKAQLGESLDLYQRFQGEAAQEDVQREQALALLAESAVLRAEGAREEAQQAAEQALELYRASSDAPGTAHALGILGLLRGSLGQVEEAQDVLGQALSIYRELGDPYGQASSLNDLGNVAAGSGKLDEARMHYDRCLVFRRQIGDLWGSGILLNNLGYLAHLKGDHAEAVQLLQQGLAIQREIGDRYHIANCLSNLGAAQRALGQLSLAAGYLYEGLELAHEIGARPLALEISAEIGVILAVCGQGTLDLAAELLAFVNHHPLTDKWTAQRVQSALTELTLNLAPEAWTAAQERAQLDTLDAVVRLVLEGARLPEAA